MSQYVLTVTPPTSDCQSSTNCSDVSSVVTVPGTQTTYTINVTGNETQISVRADTCDNRLTGVTSPAQTVDLRGNLYL